MSERIGMRWVPLVTLSILGMISTPMLPIWLAEASKRFQLTDIQGGMIASLELGSLAITSILWAALSRPGRGSSGLAIAIALSIAGNLAAFMAASALTLALARAVVGLSCGVALAEITRRAARTADPHHVFTMQQFGMVVFISLFFATVPMSIAAIGPSAPFLYSAALGLVSLFSLIWLGQDRPAEPELMAGTAQAGQVKGKAPRPIGMTFLAIGLTFMAQGAVWTYVALAARNSGVAMESLGTILAVGAVLNLLGPLGANRIGLRYGRAFPLLLGYSCLVFSILAIALGLGAYWFTAGSIGLNLSMLFLVPFLLGALAQLDSTGRSASAGPAFFTIGGSLGPMLGGFVIALAGFPALGLISVATVITALLLALTAGTRITKILAAGHG